MNTGISKLTPCIRTPIFRRWLHWIILTVILTCGGAILIPLIRANPASVHNYFARQAIWQRWFALFCGSSVFVWLLFKLSVPRFAHIRFHLPPMWTTWFAATLILGVFDFLWGLGPNGFKPRLSEWIVCCLGSVALVTLLRITERIDKEDVQIPLGSDQLTIDDLISNRDVLTDWLRNESPTSDDLVGNRRIARRLSKYIIENTGSIGLIGPFGSGKTSIIGWIKEEIQRNSNPSTTSIWFVDQSCWGFEDSGTAVQTVLSKAMAIVGKKADCFSIRSLPESYRKTFSAGGDWLGTLADLILGPTDPMEQFSSLSEILESLNARLVLVIEDLDRTTSTRFDRQEVLAFLQRVRESVPRVSFILATGQASARDIDFAKLCDHIEILNNIDVDQVSILIEATRHCCIHNFPDVIVLHKKNLFSKTPYSLLYNFDLLPPPDAAARLLSTPRAIKLALRRTHMAWSTLRGEVDYDHLLGVNILRTGAPEAYDFLIRHVTRLQSEKSQQHLSIAQIDQSESIRQRLQTEWNYTTREVDWDIRAAKVLIITLLPSAGFWLEGRKGSGEIRQQGIAYRRYWSRITREELHYDDVRDQTVLHDLASWLSTLEPDAPLVDGICQGREYSEIWLHIAHSFFRDQPDKFWILADHVLARFRTSLGLRVYTAESYPNFPEYTHALYAVRSYAQQYLGSSKNAQAWIIGQLKTAATCSLALLNDIYYQFCSSQIGLIDGNQRPLLRQVICNTLRQEIRTGEDFLRLTDPGFPDDVVLLIFPYECYNHTAELYGLEHWAWMGPPLLEALQTNPSRFAIGVAKLILMKNSPSNTSETDLEVDGKLLKGFFGESASIVVDCLAATSENFSGLYRQLLDRTVDSARSSDRSPN